MITRGQVSAGAATPEPVSSATSRVSGRRVVRLRATRVHRDLRQRCCPVAPVFRSQWHQRCFRQGRHQPGGSQRSTSRRSLPGRHRCPGPGPGSYVLLMDPELIVVGGGMAASGAALLQPLIREVQAGLAWRPAPAIVNGRFAGDAGRRGAALLAWRALQASTPH